MNWHALAGPLSRAGLTILAGALGGPAGGIVATVGPEILKALGVGTPEEAADVIAAHPDAAREALAPIVAANRDELMLAAMAHLRATTEAEQRGPAWERAWRPGWMYLLGFLWTWSLVVAPTLNALDHALGIPVAPFDVLFGLSALYVGLYMGGHTAKDVVGKWTGRAS